MKLIEKNCPMCGKVTYMKVTNEQRKEYDKYIVYGGKVQDKLKSFDKFGREFAKTGYCPECQEELFGSKAKNKDAYFYMEDLDQSVADKFMSEIEGMTAMAAIKSKAAEALSENAKLLFCYEFEIDYEEDVK